MSTNTTIFDQQRRSAATPNPTGQSAPWSCRCRRDGQGPSEQRLHCVGEHLVFDHLLDGGHRAVVVQGPDGSLLGLVTLFDLRHVQHEDWPTTPVSPIMSLAASLLMVAPSDDLRQAMGLLGGTGYHQLPVVQDGRLVGMLNRDHVLHTCNCASFKAQRAAQ